MRPILPFKIDIKRASWITDHEEWAFYHMATNERIATSRDAHLLSELTPIQKRILADIVMQEWTRV